MSMLFCRTCGMMVRTETNICPKCSSTLAPAYVSEAAKANSAPARKHLGKGAKVLLIGGIALSLVAVATAVAVHVVMRPGRSVYLLPDGNVIAYINFTPMHFMNMNTRALTADPGYQQFVNETGIQVDRDLENIAISASADGGPSGEAAIIVTGTFDQQRLSSFVQKQDGVQRETYGGKIIFSVPEKDQSARICVLDSKMVALTLSPTAESMHAIIDKSAGSGSAPHLFENYYSDVPFASAMWAIIRVPSSAVPASASSGLNLNFLKNSVTIVSVRYTGSLRLRGEFIAENQADASRIFQAVNGLLAMSKLAGGPGQNDPDVTAMMNSIEVTQNGNQVVVGIVVPQEVIQKAAQRR